MVFENSKIVINLDLQNLALKFQETFTGFDQGFVHMVLVACSILTLYAVSTPNTHGWRLFLK